MEIVIELIGEPINRPIGKLVAVRDVVGGGELSWCYNGTTCVKGEEIRCACNGGRCTEMLVRLKELVEKEQT